MARNLPEDDLETGDSDRGHGSLGLFYTAWNHKLLLLLGVVIGLTLGALNYLRKQPIYQSNAQLLVINKRPALNIVGVDWQSSGSSDDFAAAHLSVIKSRLVIDRTLKNLDVNQYTTFAGGDPVYVLTEGLNVVRDNRDTRSTSNAVLNLTFNGPTANECPDILLAIINSYKSFLDATYKDDRASTFEEIRKMKERLEEDLNKSKKDYEAFRKETPVIPKGKDGVTAQQESLTKIEQKRTDVRTQIATLQARLNAIQKEIAAGRDPTPLLELTPDLEKPQPIDTLAQARVMLDDKVLLLLTEERKLSEYWGKDHPEVENVRSRIKLVRDYFAQNYAVDLKPETRVDKATVESRVAKFRLQLDDLKEAEVALGKLLVDELEEFKKLARFLDQENDLQKHIARTEQSLDGLISRLAQGGSAKDSPYGGYKTEVLIPPSMAFKVEPRAMSTFGVALFLGLTLGLGLAWLAEVSDKSFRTPEEIRRRLGLPIVGHIPFMKSVEPAADGVGLDPLLCTYHHSKSVHAEAYRGVRTALYFSTQGEGHQVIQVTSPSKGDGKSTMAANLAVSIAQSGKRVLIVDADFRRPRQHKIFNLTGRVGVATVMAGEADLDGAIQPTVIPNLFVLPCGMRPANPAELLTLPQFAELLNTLRGRYDFVIVDTPPLLAVSDPSVVAPRVDGVLLTIRVSKNGRPQAERAKEILTGLGANILGVVVNGVGRLRDGYEDSQYTYGYGYSYGYAYTYSYEPEDVQSYYDDPESGVDLTSGVHRNGTSSAAPAKQPPSSSSDVDLGAPPVQNGTDAVPSRRRQRTPSTLSGGSSRRTSRSGVISWIRRLWS